MGGIRYCGVTHAASTDQSAFVRAAVSLIPKQFEHSGRDGGAIETQETGELKVTDLARRISHIIERAAADSGPAVAERCGAS